MNTNPETQLIPSPINPSLYMDAIRIGQQVLLEQGSKASAAMEIFKILKDESRESKSSVGGYPHVLAEMECNFWVIRQTPNSSPTEPLEIQTD